ncbi:MAG: DUF2341 domain-containing protein, partial [Candidatus Micrarchaeia archaeon]
MVKLDLTKIWQYLYGTLKTTKTTFRRFRKTNVLEIQPIPTYRRTEKQDKVRNTFTFCIDTWKSLSEEDKAKWKEEGTRLKLTGYQAFLSYCLRNPTQFLHYKVKIDNSNNPSDLTDYQILINVVNDATFFNTFANSHVFMEVYDSDGITPLSFYVEEWDQTNKNAKIWVKVPFIPANSIKYIYLRYNGKRTTTLSNGPNTFVFFDDFESYPEGSNINNQGGWITKRIGGSGEAKIRVINDRKHLRLYSTSYGTTVVHQANVSNAGYAFRVKVWMANVTDSFNQEFGDGNITTGGEVYNGYSFTWWGWANTASKIRQYVNGTSTDLASISDSGVANRYYLFEILWLRSSLKA